MQLRKRIPIGAGLAGGSSDGAAALVGLNQLWGLGFSSEALHGFAAELGSDLPFCLEGGTRLCFGRGEVLEAAGLPGLPPLAVLLIKDPSASVSTPWAYGRCRELRGDFYLDDETDFEQRRQALRQGPLLAALRANGRCRSCCAMRWCMAVSQPRFGSQPASRSDCRSGFVCAVAETGSA